MKKLLTIYALVSLTAAFSQITINSNFPSNMSAGSSIDADVKINKGAVGNFAKYQLDVPSGYMISMVDAKGGNFTFENQRAKIVWVSVPSEAEFVIKLKIQANSDAVNPGVFSQKFYYLENNEKKEVEASPITITIGGDAGTMASNPVAVNTPVTTTQTETKPALETPTETKPVEAKPIESKSTVSTPTESKPSNTSSNSLSTNKPLESSPVKSKSSTSSINEAGMTFKVQIGAYATEPAKGKFSGVGKVNIDLINGMYKITTGNFKSYDEAAKHRDDLKAKGYKGFIAKYKDGVRIN